MLKIEDRHLPILDLLSSNPRAGAATARSNTGPFGELRQVAVYAAALGYALGSSRKAGASSKVQIPDGTMLGASGARELSFALLYSQEWKLGTARDDESTASSRVKVIESYAACGFDFLEQIFVDDGETMSAVELMKAAEVAIARRRASESVDRDEQDPLLAILDLAERGYGSSNTSTE